MIAKGKCRAKPAQLAAYCLRAKEEPVLLQLDDGGDSLHKAFVQWDAIGSATRGERTLYHAQIAPEARYDMTHDQWRRAAEILAEELGMKDHPRAVILHPNGKNPHIHVVFQRTNIETMTMWDDGKNYEKHERASHRMEEEFGHEHIPGKHAKRDREKQPDFPKEEFNQNDHQQAERTKVSPAERKAEITALRASADNALAFKHILEEAGYMLARGDQRGFVLVNQDAEIFSLSKYITDIKGKAYTEFMAPIDRASLPSTEEAKELQRQAKEARGEKEREEERRDEKPLPAKQSLPASPAEEPAAEDALSKEELRKLQAALTARHASEAEAIKTSQQADIRYVRQQQTQHIKDQAGYLKAHHEAEWNQLRQERRDHDKSVWGYIDAMVNRWNPQRRLEQAEGRRREVEAMKARHRQERLDLLVLLRQNRDQALEALKEEQAKDRIAHGAKYDQELERYTREYETARALLAKEEEKRKTEELKRDRDGPERPPPSLTQ